MAYITVQFGFSVTFSTYQNLHRTASFGQRNKVYSVHSVYTVYTLNIYGVIRTRLWDTELDLCGVRPFRRAIVLQHSQSGYKTTHRHSLAQEGALNILDVFPPHF